MATTSDAEEQSAVASHTLTYLRSLDMKLDVVVDALQRHGERLSRVERDLGETRRDIIEVKSDVACSKIKWWVLRQRFCPLSGGWIMIRTA